MKRIFLTLSCILVIAGSAAASWMGETWLWVRVEKTFPHEFASGNRKVTIKVLKWALGAGHGDHYGKTFPGKNFTINLRCKNPTYAKLLKVGETFWVKHHASSSFGRDPITGKRRSHSSSWWQQLGHDIWVWKPVVVRNLVRGEELPSSPPQILLWALRHGNNITVKVRHETGGKLDSVWRVYHVKETRTSVTLAIVFSNHDRPGVHYANPSKVQDHLLQFSAAAFEGKKIILETNGKLLIEL